MGLGYFYLITLTGYHFLYCLNILKQYNMLKYDIIDFKKLSENKRQGSLFWMIEEYACFIH